MIDWAKQELIEGSVKGAAKNYLGQLKSVLGEKQHVIDSNPANLFELGLIHLSFPNSRIIQTVRDGSDASFAIYSTPTQNPPEFACDRSNIAFALEEFARLSEHWRNVVPADRLLDVRYEDLLTQPSVTTSEILNFCGLDGDNSYALSEAELQVLAHAIGISKHYT